jgi:hypothetical protein
VPRLVAQQKVADNVEERIHVRMAAQLHVSMLLPDFRNVC